MSMASYGAKLTLVNSVLISIAVYAMCSIRLPVKIVEHVDKIQRLCLWRKNGETRTAHGTMATWHMICKPKDNGGMGVLYIKTLNTVLLLKFLDKFYNKRNLPWANLVWNTYHLDTIPHASPAQGSFWSK